MRTPEQRGSVTHSDTDLMESLNLNALAGSLPTSNLASAEKELLNNFRGNPQFSPPLRRLTFD
jgi:hypothetical protein